MKQKKGIQVFFQELLFIGADILHVYKNFLHWNISKICIYIWSLLLGIIVAFPPLIIVLIVGLIDPISWMTIVTYILGETHLSENGNQLYEVFSLLISHPFWFLFMSFLIIITMYAFLTASTYTLLLLARLSFKYVKRTNLNYKKNLYFSKKHIITFFVIISYNLLLLIIPAIFFFGINFLLYLGVSSEVITLSFYKNFVIIFIVVFILALSYFLYRMLFSYIILATHKDIAVQKGWKYIKKSFFLTKLWKNYFKFIAVLVIYFFIMTPFRAIEDYIDTKISELRDVYTYRLTDETLFTERQKQYYDFINSGYKDMTEEEIISKIYLYSRLNMVYFFLSFFLISGIFVTLMTSFYMRVLKQPISGHKKNLGEL